MRYLFYAFFISISLFGSSLDELIEYALSHSSIIKHQEIDIKKAKLKKRESRISQYGDINIVAEANHYNSARTLAPLTPSVMMSGLPVTTSKTIYSVGILYSVPLFTGFAQTREIQMSEIAKKMAEVKIKLTKEQLVYNIRTLYISILAQTEMLKAQKSYTKALSRLRDNISYEVETGKKARIDLLKAEAELQSSIGRQEFSRSNIDVLKATLSSLVGERVNEVQNVDTEVKKPDYSLRGLYKKIDSLSRTKIYDLGIKKAEKAVQKSKSLKYPRISLDSYFGKNYGDDTGPNGWDDANLVQVGLKLKYTLFDFGKSDIASQKAKLSEMEAKLDKSQMLLDIKKMIIEATSNINKSYFEYISSKKEFALSKKSEEIESIRYQNGVSTVNDLLLAKSRSELALAKVIKAKYDYKKSIYYLDYVLERGVK